MHASPVSLSTLALAAVALLSPMAPGQADFAESFENNGADTINGPQNLVNQGWIFRNQCVPVNQAPWYDGNGFGGQPFDGSGYLACDSMATDWIGGEYSVWAILPEIPNQQAGDEFSLWVFGGGSPTYNTWFEVRYAPSGTSTGAGPDDIGDFTEVLYSAEMPIAQFGYQRISADIPGPGRVALRMRADYMMTFAGRGFYLSVDTLTVGGEPDDPCGVPIPDPGETVTWTAADGPYHICQNLLIPDTATVIVEPGATITIEPGQRLRVEGEIIAHGTAEDPIVFNGSTSIGDGLEVGGIGDADIAFAEIHTNILGAGQDAVLIVRDSYFGPTGVVSGIREVAIIERCVFEGGGSPVFHSLVAGAVQLTESTFSGGASAQITGFSLVEHVDVDGGQLRFQAESANYPVLLQNISVTNYPNDAGITLEGPNYLFGENVELANNLYSLHITGLGAGVYPGSELPQSGNNNNYILADAFYLGFERQWAHTGLDYLVASEFPENYGGTINIGPGATVRFGPNVGAFIVGSGTVGLNGTRENPITLKSDTPARWFGLKWVDVFDAVARHTIFDGGQITVQSDGGNLDLMNCTVQNSLEGTASVTGGLVRLWNSRIINNQVGMVTTSTGRIEANGTNSPNIFDGNAVAIEYNNPNNFPFLRFNWWGDPTGPTNPLHPAGQGDEVQNVHPAAFTPYLTSPPAQDDDFPVVKMMPIYFTANTGDKIILRWESSDDDAVVEHRVQFADHDFPAEFETLATLPGDANTWELTVPLVEPNNLYPTPSAVRIVAVDSAGQESWDKTVLRVPYLEDWNVVYQDVATPPPSHPRDTLDLCWSPGGNATVYIMYDSVFMSSYHGGSNTGCLPTGGRLPYVSTDRARVVVLTSFGAGGRAVYSFSDEFQVRPDTRIDDAPPTVSMTAPQSGSSYSGGGTVPVRWTADDDIGLRAFHIQASFDAGRTWHYIARDLPPEARAFDWDLPESSGIPQVRLRVIAADTRFQDTSSAVASLAILAGSGCTADFNGDGALDFFDVADFLDAFSAQDPIADLTGDGLFDFFDVADYLDLFSAGCP